MKAPLTQLQKFARHSDETLRYIIKNAREAAANMRGLDDKAEAKYLDQINDASTILARRRAARADVCVINHGSLILVYPKSRAAKAWVAANVGEYQTFGPHIVVEPRFIDDLIGGMQGDGLVVL